MKSYTWQYNETVTVKFSTKQALITDDRHYENHTYSSHLVKFPNPNDERLGLYNAKLVADRMVELGYDLGGRKVLAIKAMRDNVPFQAVLSEIKARAEIESQNPALTAKGEYLIRIPLACDYELVKRFMTINNIKWH